MRISYCDDCKLRLITGRACKCQRVRTKVRRLEPAPTRRGLSSKRIHGTSPFWLALFGGTSFMSLLALFAIVMAG